MTRMVNDFRHLYNNVRPHETLAGDRPIERYLAEPDDAAYEKRSIALTSNIHPAGFDELMPKTLAAATVDRLLHHAHVLLTEGTDSYRLAQATAGRGVMPLT